MESAGVESGEKILVELGGVPGPAAHDAAAAPKNARRNCNGLLVISFFDSRICNR
jgi:hypothetical protein